MASKEFYREFGYPRYYISQFFPKKTAEIIYNIRQEYDSDLTDNELIALLTIYMNKKLVDDIPRIAKNFKIDDFIKYIEVERDVKSKIDTIIKKINISRDE